MFAKLDGACSASSYQHRRDGLPLPIVADRVEGFRRAILGVEGESAPTTTVRQDLASLWYDLAGSPFSTHAETRASVVGESRILYGSDSCWTPPHAVAAQIASMEAAPAPRTAHRARLACPHRRQRLAILR